MKKDVTSFLNGTIEFVLIGVLLIVFVSSFYVASSIYPNTFPDHVLGASTANRDLTVSKTQNITSYKENATQISIGIKYKFEGNNSLILDIGKLNNKTDTPHNYRVSFSTPDLYLHDFDAYLLVNGKNYDVLVNGKEFSNNILIAQNVTVDCQLKLVPHQPMYYQIEGSLNIYK